MAPSSSCLSISCVSLDKGLFPQYSFLRSVIYSIFFTSSQEWNNWGKDRCIPSSRQKDKGSDGNTCLRRILPYCICYIWRQDSVNNRIYSLSRHNCQTWKYNFLTLSGRPAASCSSVKYYITTESISEFSDNNCHFKAGRILEGVR